MEERRFDDLTRAFGRATSRRQVFKGLLAGLAGSLLGAPAAGAAKRDAQADCGKGARQACMKDAERSFQLCTRSCNASACKNHAPIPGEPNLCAACHATCIANMEAEKYSCRNGDGCLPGHTCCSTGCTDLRSDAGNCGACGAACAGDEVCDGGSCNCPDGEEKCDGACVDTSTSGDNCGACGVTCGACETCHGGYCLPTDCGDGLECCKGSCVPASCPPGEHRDDTTCQCVADCPDTCPTCQECDAASGQCQPVSDGAGCGSGLVCCHGSCVSNSCPPGQVFDLESCGCQCQTNEGCSGGKICCNGGCVDGTCPPGQQFDPGTCGCQCATGTTCGPFCCADNKVCCPDALSGMSCRDPDANCPGCTYTCGDQCCPQDKFCCRAADYSYHCVDNSGDTC